MVRPPLYLAVLLAFVIAAEGRVPTDDELKTISAHLSGLDRSYPGLIVNVPAILSTNVIKDDLIKGPVPDTMFNGKIDKALRELHEKFNHPITFAEDPAIFSAAKTTFLDEIMKTLVMKETEMFLKTMGLITTTLRDVLDNMWFGLYSRSLDAFNNKIASSCGFEHVFMGETKFDKPSSNKETVIGFHNWIFYYTEQKAGRFVQFQYNENLVLDATHDRNMGKLKIYWWKGPTSVASNALKVKQGSFFFGTSPELEMALYTICFLSRPNAPGTTGLCPVKLFGKDMNIVTTYIQDAWALDGNHATARNRVGNAHPAS